MTVLVRSSQVQQQQIGQESSPGTSNPPANRRLSSMSFDVTDELGTQVYRMQGRRHDNRVEPEMQWSTMGLSGHLDYNEYLYALEAAFLSASPTQTLPGQALSYQRIYQVPVSGKFNPKTYTLQWGDTNNVNQVGYGLMSDIGFSATRKTAPAVTGAGIAQLKAQASGNAFTSTPTVVDAASGPEPVLANQINYYFDATWAGLGTTQVPQEFLSVNWGYKGLFVPFWASNRSFSSYAGHLDSKLATEVKINVAESTLSQTLDAAMSTGTTYFLRVECVGPVIEVVSGPHTYSYNLIFDMALKLTKKDKYGEADDVYMRTWSFDIVEDLTSGNACTITSMTAIATL